ncbi:MAG: hypothetical protein ABII64_06925 [Elusimicrobiota bacterium]
MRRFCILAAVVIGLAGCVSVSGVPRLKNWPKSTPETQTANGAILLKVQSVSDIPGGFYVTRIFIRFFNREVDPETAAAGYDLKNPGSKANELILVYLPPGRYSISPMVGVTRNDFNWLKMNDPGGAFEDVYVRPGVVTPVGILSLKTTIVITSANSDGSVSFNSTGKSTWEDQPDAQRKILREALADPRAGPLNWKPGLQAALDNIGKK